jgi:RNA polymerase sigma-70 factor (ECF subfamily)
MKRSPSITNLAADTFVDGRTTRGSDLTKRPDTLAFEEVYASNAERVLNLAYRLTGDEETARDLCQEIFVKVYQNLASFEHRSQVSTWIYRIAVNHISNYLKKERRLRWVRVLDRDVSDIIREDDIEPVFRRRTSTPTSEQRLEQAQRAQIVWGTIQTLPVKYRVPLVLHHYEGLSYKDIADAMQLSMSAVESRIHRAKRQLIKKLQPWLGKI